ncbi:MAG TPA: SH3 domain-containing protein [Phototrophicaceae bacterium]|nr:SH3 domain-containing protein [Phototrophicaceae bacterium]
MYRSRSSHHRHQLSLVLLLMLAALSAITMTASAQPGAVTTALNDVNTRTGKSYTLTSVGYRWSEYPYDGNNLGCSSVQNTSPGTYRGYQIEFDTDFDGVFEWDYRISTDGAIFILCSQPVVAQPTTESPAVPTVPPSTPSFCSGLLPRMAIGQQGKVLPSDPNIMRQTPETRGAYVTDIPVGGVVTVLDGPRCTGTMTWLQVDYNGQVGWTVENDGSEYWLEAIDLNAAQATAQPTAGPSATPEAPVNASTGINTSVTCDGSIPSRLAKGTEGRVLPGAPNNLRADPTVNGAKIGQIPGSETFNVVDGPRCAEGYTWWQAEYKGTTGWTVEAVDGEYVVEPPTVWQPITAQNVNSLKTYTTFVPEALVTGYALISRFRFMVFNSELTAALTGQLAAGAYTWGIDHVFDTPQGNSFFPPAPTTSGDFAGGIILNDGTTLAYTLDFEQVRITHLPDSNPMATITAATAVNQVVISPDGHFAATIDANNHMDVWDILPGGPTFQTTVYSRNNQGLSGTGFTFSPDGQILLLGSNLQIDALSTVTWQPIFTLATDVYATHLTVSPNGQRLALVGSTSTDGTNLTARVYNLSNQSLVWGSPGEGANLISRPTFNADGSVFAMVDSQGDRSTLRFYDTELGDILTGFPLQNPAEAQFTRDGTMLVLSYEENFDLAKLEFWAVINQ